MEPPQRRPTETNIGNPLLGASSMPEYSNNGASCTGNEAQDGDDVDQNNHTLQTLQLGKSDVTSEKKEQLSEPLLQISPSKET